MKALSLDESRVGASVVRRWRSARGSLDAGHGEHDALEITWIQEGAIVITWPGHEHVVSAGQVVVVPAGQRHRTRFLTASVAGSLKLEPAALRGDPRFVGTITDPAASRLIAIGELLYDEARRNDVGAPRIISALGDALVVELTRQETARAHTVPPVLRAMLALFEDELAAPLRIAEVARRLGLSRFQLARLTREHLGKSAHALLEERRLERARELLARSPLNVTAVATSVGYGDPGRFSRAFRHRYGTLPADYRRALTCGRARCEKLPNR